MYVYMYEFSCVCLFICVNVCIYVCMYVCMHVYMYVCVNIMLNLEKTKQIYNKNALLSEYAH